MDSSSSDGSFAWTDASSDTIDSAAMVNDNMNKTHSDDESVSGKSYKQKLQDELFARSNGNVEERTPQSQETPHKRKRKLTEQRSSSEQASPNKKKIKMEPDSDVDTSTNKHKTNGHNNSESYDESYLNLKVKAEEQFTPPSLTKTKKRKTKMSTNIDVVNDESSEMIIENFKNKCKGEDSDAEDDKLDQLVQIEMNQHEKKSKKKKKKSKNKENSDVYSEANHTDNSHIEHDGTISSSGHSPPPPPHSPPPPPHSPPPPHHSTLLEVSDDIISKHNPNSSRDKNIDSHQNSPLIKNAFNKTVSHTPSIPERIQFEDDESSDMETGQLQSSKSTTRSSKLKTFLKNNSNLKPYTSGLRGESALTIDDEIWIVRCPKEVDVDAFKHKDLTLEGRCKLKLNSQTYEGFVDTESMNISILSSEQSHLVIRSLPVKGCLNLRKRIPKTHIRDEAIVNNQTNFIPLPETKCRHPLFGANYRKAIKLPTKVSERLRAPSPGPGPGPGPDTGPGAPSAVKKRKHKEVNLSKGDHHHHLHGVTKAEHISEDTADPEMEADRDHPVRSKKKKKKRKHSESEEIAPKKKKRTKHDLESAEAWESEQAIEENLFNF